MTNEHKRHILLCLVGGTPQVVTETLYALTQKHDENIDEIIVITTPLGRGRIFDTLLKSKTGKFFQFCRDYKIDPKKIKFDDTTILLLRKPTGQVLEDLVTEEDNRHAINHICEIVRGLTLDPETRIHASVGGGRKTMSIGLTSAMQLFGRGQDRLSHVLVAAEYEQHREFFYPRPKPEVLMDREGKPIKARQWVSLAEIEYIRLSGILSEWMGHEQIVYSKLVKQAQDELELEAGKLRVYLTDDRISMFDRSIDLPDQQFFVYVLLLRAGSADGSEYFRPAGMTRKHLERVFEYIVPHRNPNIFRAGEDRSIDWAVPGYDFLQKWIEKIDGGHAVEIEKYFNTIKSKINRELKSRKIPPIFHIKKRGKTGNAEFGIEAPRSRFVFVVSKSTHQK